MDCIFCKIIGGEIPSDKVYEDEYVYAFRDINPIAPVHILVIPKKHYANIGEMPANEAGRLVSTTSKIAAEQEALGGSYRLVTNTGDDAGQSVKHVHIHILGGKALSWEC